MDQKTPRDMRHPDEGEIETIMPLPGEVAPPPKRDLFTLSPINRRRWQNFRANQRGYWSLWIFLRLFFLSLFAEFLANDKPLIVSYKGEILFPVFVDYPEEKFGGFFAVTDYRSPFIRDEINAHGWMLWPPIRYSYRTANLDFPIDALSAALGETVGFPTAPNWLHLDALCKTPSDDEKVQHYCSPAHWNWLGTDDQGRDVLARLIYGFRLSVLFGFALTVLSSAVGVTAGAVQGYFGGCIDLFFQRFIEIWTSIPSLYLLLIISSVLVPGFFVLLGILLLFSWVALVGVVRAEFLRARNFGYVKAARGARRRQPDDHVPPPPAERHGGDADLHAVHPERLDHHADLARLPRPRHAARLALARRASGAGQEQPAGAVARHHRLHRHLADAVAADLRRRGGARRLRPAQDLRQLRRQRRRPAAPRSAETFGDPRRCTGAEARSFPSAISRSSSARARASSMPCAASPSTSARRRRWRWSANRAPASR